MKNKLNLRTDLIGQKVGKLLVLGPGPVRGKTNRSHWLCKCDCGSETSVLETRLLSGKLLGCGCLRGQRVNSIKNPVGLLIDKWSKAQMWRFYQYSYGAVKRGHTFELTHEQFESISKKNCAYCNAPPKNYSKIPSRDKSTRRSEPWLYNGIDRIDNNGNYTVENCVPCCKMCNTAKSNYTLQEFLYWIDRVYNHTQGALPAAA